jgi:hypothetical protein
MLAAPLVLRQLFLSSAHHRMQSDGNSMHTLRGQHCILPNSVAYSHFRRVPLAPAYHAFHLRALPIQGPASGRQTIAAPPRRSNPSGRPTPSPLLAVFWDRVQLLSRGFLKCSSVSDCQHSIDKGPLHWAVSTCILMGLRLALPLNDMHGEQFVEG